MPLVARFAAQMLGTLAHMYALLDPVVHNDVDLKNVFVHWGEGQPLPGFWLGDFGLAQLSSEGNLM